MRRETTMCEQMTAMRRLAANATCPHLQAVYDERILVEGHGPIDEQYIITKHRTAEANLRTQLLRIIRKAGIERGRSFSSICGQVE
jgi:hypothetical protein